MRTKYTSVCLATLLALTTPTLAAEDASLRSAVDRFVALDCTVGDPAPADHELKLHGDLAVPLLQRLLDNGPESNALQQARAEIERHWEARLEFLEASGRTGLPVASQQNVELRAHDEFLERRLSRFGDRTRERAAMAMAAIGSPAARRALAESASRQQGAMREFIDRLLLDAGSRPGRARRSRPRR